VKLDPGLDEAEMSAVEEQYSISFGDDHRALLTLATLPQNQGSATRPTETNANSIRPARGVAEDGPKPGAP